QGHFPDHAALHHRRRQDRARQRAGWDYCRGILCGFRGNRLCDLTFWRHLPAPRNVRGDICVDDRRGRPDRRHEKTRSGVGALEGNTGDTMNRLASFYSEKESHILGAGFIVLLIVLWELIPHLLTVSKGMALFFTTPLRVVEVGYQLIVENKIQEHLLVSSIEFL